MTFGCYGTPSKRYWPGTVSEHTWYRHSGPWWYAAQIAAVRDHERDRLEYGERVAAWYRIQQLNPDIDGWWPLAQLPGQISFDL